MRIDEAIRQTREFAKIMRELGERYAKEDERSIAAETAFQDAETLETVCNALEAANVVDVLAESAGDGRNGAE